MFSAVNKEVFLNTAIPKATYITHHLYRSYTGTAMLFTVAVSVGFIHEGRESLFLPVMLAKHN